MTPASATSLKSSLVYIFCLKQPTISQNRIVDEDVKEDSMEYYVTLKPGVTQYLSPTEGLVYFRTGFIDYFNGSPACRQAGNFYNSPMRTE